jgi:hypothetical protein
MDDDEEQPIAIAFSDSLAGTVRQDELVFDGDIFWGTIYINYFPLIRSTLFLTTRNNRRIQTLVRLLPLPAPLQNLLVLYLHHHWSE